DLVRQALSERMATLPDAVRRTLTWDQGKEMAGHMRFRVDTGIPAYLCDPLSPWQRLTYENTNGVRRQYFLRTANLAAYAQEDLDAVAREPNARPRCTLAWRNSAEVFLSRLLRRPRETARPFEGNCFQRHWGDVVARRVASTCPRPRTR